MPANPRSLSATRLILGQKNIATETSPLEDGRMARPNGVFLVVFGLALLYTFLLSLDILTHSVSLLAGPMVNSIMQATLNPLVGVCIGLLVTATLQSSSAVTSILVAMVVAGAISLEQAIPIVMGSNMGTTFTAFLVALSHISSKREFRKGMAASLLHVFFNLGATLLIFPLEHFYKALTKASQAGAAATQTLIGAETGMLGHGLRSIISPVTNRLITASSTSWLWVFVALGMLFGCILLFRTVFKILWMRDYERKLNETVFSRRLQALGWGAGLTAFIHSSTVTTSLCVPLAATGAVTVRKLLPFIVGANIGTTLTALMAALGRSEAGIALAFSHVLFNVCAGILVLGINPAGMGLVQVARRVAASFAKNRSLALMFLVVFFFALPLLVIYLNVR